MGRVFIPQLVERYDQATGRMTPVFDFSAAAHFGQLTPILEKSDNVQFLAFLAPKIRKALSDFGPDDHFLAVGDPTVIAMCAGIIFRRQQKVSFLKWDRVLKMYNSIEVNP
jgi:hypothetical protein